MQWWQSLRKTRKELTPPWPVKSKDNVTETRPLVQKIMLLKSLPPS